MRSLSFNTLKVLRVFVMSTSAEYHGYRLGKMTGDRPQTLYDMLHEMHAQGWFNTRIDSTIPKRQTKLYSITEKGLGVARQALAAVQLPSSALMVGST